MQFFKNKSLHASQRLAHAARPHRAARFGIMLLAILLASCSMDGLLSSGHPISGGAIAFQVNASASRILLPNIDMTIARYTFSGTGPIGATFSATATSTTYTAANLIQGSWSITVNGLNAAGTVIDTGTTSVNVATGQTATVNVTVAPVVGNGTLAVTLNWPAELVSSAQVSASLTSTTGVVTPLAFSAPANGTSTYTGTVASGYYTLCIQLLDTGQLVMGSVEIVRIVTAQTTTGTYNYTSINVGDPTIIVNITPAVTNPIPVTVSGAVATVATGTAMTLAASVPAGTAVTYVWYVNGISVGTGATFALNTAASPLAAGVYRVDCVAISTNGLNAGDSTSFTTVTAAQAPRTYTTSFPLAETPLSSSGNWINGGVVGLDWNNVVTSVGLAHGQGPSSATYSDPTAVVSGTWGPNQTAQGTVYSVAQTASLYQEVELRLRTTITAHSITGYEINFRCLKDSNAYMQIVRWNGALGGFTVVASYNGAQYGVANGDVVKASIVGNKISVYINNVLVGSGTDSVYSTGSPGIGFDFGCGSTYGNFGFTTFSAADGT
jgi:hypothetical protein